MYRMYSLLTMPAPVCCLPPVLMKRRAPCSLDFRGLLLPCTSADDAEVLTTTLSQGLRPQLRRVVVSGDARPRIQKASSSGNPEQTL